MACEDTCDAHAPPFAGPFRHEAHRLARDTMTPTRRAALGLGLIALSLPRTARTQSPDAATLFVAGPQDAQAAGWADRIGAALARGLTQATTLRVQAVGAADGIAAANRFATASAPDGRSLLAFTPSAAMARAQGDSRARFDPALWIALCATAVPAALVGRGPPPARAARLRLALSAPNAAEATTLFALDALGIGATPVLGITQERAEAALAQGVIDAALLSGPALAERAHAVGARLWLGADAFAGGRDPDLSEVPAFGEMFGAAQDVSRETLRLGMAAFRLRGLVVLPALMPGEILGAWRQAAHRWAEDRAREPEDGALPLATRDLPTALAALGPNPQTSRAYRDWLAHRLDWRAA